MKTALRVSASILLLVLFSFPDPLASQSGGAIQPGSRVRVTVTPGSQAYHTVAGTLTSSGETLTGRWDSEDSGTLLLHDQGGAGIWHIPVESVQRLEVSQGRTREWGKTTAKWVGVAAGAAGLVSAVAWTPCEETGFMACFLAPRSRGEAFAWGAGAGAIIGLPIGLIAGSRWKESWTSESLQGMKASVRATGEGRLGLGIAIPTGGR